MKKQNHIVTFTCSKSIHHYKGITGVVPCSPYKSHRTIEDAKDYLKTKGIDNPKIVEK